MQVLANYALWGANREALAAYHGLYRGDGAASHPATRTSSPKVPHPVVVEAPATSKELTQP